MMELIEGLELTEEMEDQVDDLGWRVGHRLYGSSFIQIGRSQYADDISSEMELIYQNIEKLEKILNIQFVCFNSMNQFNTMLVFRGNT